VSDPDSLTAFFLSLDERPGDHVTLLALADWYEEQGQSNNANCLRWTVRNAVYPFRYRRDGGLTVSTESWHDGWYWWAYNDTHYGKDWGHPLHCRLPLHVWNRLRHNFNYAPSVVKQYPTLRDAYEAMFEAWPLVGPLAANSTRGSRT
jgi:uncharacterized protein (TIGR02996 family)